MNPISSQISGGGLENFPMGEISKRLESIPDLAAQDTGPVDPYRAAAAVMVAFEPGTLKPAPAEEDTLKPEPVGTPPLKSALELLPASIPAPYAEKLAGYPWALPVDDRKKVLRELQTEKALQEALHANPKRPDSLLQQTLSGAIEGSTFVVDQMGSEELAALATVADWLDDTDIAPRLPDSASVREVLERRRHRDSLERLRGEAFTGREAETARIKAYFNSNSASVLWVAAPGGTGKSALLAHALLSWSPPETNELLDPEKIWVRVDLDASSVRLDQPMSLLAEAARQLARRFPDESLLPGLVRAASYVASASDQKHSDFESFGFREGWDYSQVIQMFQSTLLTVTNAFRKRFVLWVDTFEEAQFLGETVVGQLLQLIGDVSANYPPIRVVISGRVGPGKVTTVGTRPIEALQLTDLPDPPASDLLGKFVHQIAPAKTLRPEALKKAVGILGGNPLTLRLASRLLAEGDGATLEEFESVKKEALQQQLYSRVLEHIHDEEVSALAMPGLVVRRITPAIIRHVLAGPCGLKIDSDKEAKDLFDEVAREVTLVEPDGPDALVHVQHVRKLMLEAMPAHLEKAIAEIDRLAVEYWQEKGGPQARAEEIYHRLRLKQPVEELDRRWEVAAGSYLADALEELPTGMVQYAWLASRLHVEASGAEPGEQIVPQSVWERDAETRVRRLLEGKQYDEALKILRERTERVPGSPLYGLESRTLLFHGDPVTARAKAMEGVEASRKDHKEVAVDLALFAAFIDERTGELTRSLESADLAVRISKATSLETNLAALLRKIRHHRVAAAAGVIIPQRKTVENRRKAARSIAFEAGPNRLAGNPTVLRELAAELGDLEPEFLRWASHQLLEELLTAMPAEQVVSFLQNSEIVQKEEAVRLANSASGEVVKVARHAILERISSRDPQPAFANRLQQLYRDSVDAIFARDYTAAEKQAIPPTPSPKRTKASTVELEDLISRYLRKLPKDVSAIIARFGASLSQGSFKSLTRDPSAVGKTLLKRAEQLDLVPQLLAQMEDYVAKHLPDEDLTVLHDYQKELSDKKAAKNKRKKQAPPDTPQ